MKKMILMAASLCFALGGCATKDGPDLAPIGNGLGLIGLSLVLSALIGRFGPERRKKGDPHEND